MRFIKTLLILFLLCTVSYSAKAQIVAPTGITTRASSQLVYYYDVSGSPGSTDIQVTNTNDTEGVTIHVQIFRSFDPDEPGTGAPPTICDERDFNDFLTPNDTHVYDLSTPNFDKNSGEAETTAGESTSVQLISPPTRGFVVITPVVSEADLSAISFQYLTGTSNDDTRTFIINAMGRDAVNFTTGETVADGTPLDGVTNGYVVLQPEELLFDFEADSNPVDIVGIAFNDVYGDPGLLGYQVTPGEVNWTSFIFDYKEDPTSCGDRTVGCFLSTGLNDNIPHADIDFNGNDLLCTGSTSAPQPDISFQTGWTRIFVSGMDDFENHVGVFYNPTEGGADFMFVRGQRTEITPPPTNEVCDDAAMADEDGNGFANCLDPACATASNCETGEAQCNDQVDNDNDTKIDCADEGCDGFDSCEFGTEVSCNDGIDNDADGLTDSEDPDCQASDTGGTTGSGGGGGGCVVAGSVSAATAAANFLLPMIPLFGAYEIRRRKIRK